jgi:hypothetical protein
MAALQGHHFGILLYLEIDRVTTFFKSLFRLDSKLMIFCLISFIAPLFPLVAKALEITTYNKTRLKNRSKKRLT